MTTETETTGKHWAIQTCWKDGAIDPNSQPDYVRGDDAADAEEAERFWRHKRGLFFIGATVRRTTPEEDAKLAG